MDDADFLDSHGYKIHQEITDQIIKGYFSVCNTLGYGFLEKAYEYALLMELCSLSQGLFVVEQVPIMVFFKEQQVGEYYADLIVENKVIVELKAAESLCEDHEFQSINYLKATDIEVCL